MLFMPSSVDEHSFSCMCATQRVCQRKGACGEQERVPEAEASAADRERAERISGVDLQSR